MVYARLTYLGIYRRRARRFYAHYYTARVASRHYVRAPGAAVPTHRVVHGTTRVRRAGTDESSRDVLTSCARTNIFVSDPSRRRRRRGTTARPDRLAAGL